jgi:site-specific recombinase XerD
MLRHSFATCQIVSGQNVFKVQNWMGHGSLKSTLPYVHLSENVLSESTDLMISGNYKKV